MAVNILSTFSHNIVHGTVTVCELHEVSCFKSAIEQSMQAFYAIPFQRAPFPDKRIFVTALRRRLKEYRAYIERREKLSRLVSHCKDVAPGNSVSITTIT